MSIPADIAAECERCGKTIKRPIPEPGDFVVSYVGQFADFERVDLCNDCMESFDRWFRGVIE